MISIRFVSIFAACAVADQSPWEGVSCGDGPLEGDECKYGLEKVYNADGDRAKCCQSGMESTYDHCKCLPCFEECDSTESAQTKMKQMYLALNYTDADATAAADTYTCATSIVWPTSVNRTVQPEWKCCLNVTADHVCNCPPKNDTKLCYSTWSNPWLNDCEFKESKSGMYCCVDSASGECRSDEGSVEGWSDWAGCWGSTQADCNELAHEERGEYNQTSGCVYDVTPPQKYCGNTATSSLDCQDQRQEYVDNNCGLGAVSDTAWFENNVSDDTRLDFKALQAISGPTGYCGSYWLESRRLSQEDMFV